MERLIPDCVMTMRVFDETVNGASLQNYTRTSSECAQDEVFWDMDKKDMEVQYPGVQEDPVLTGTTTTYEQLFDEITPLLPPFLDDQMPTGAPEDAHRASFDFPVQNGVSETASSPMETFGSCFLPGSGFHADAVSFTKHSQIFVFNLFIPLNGRPTEVSSKTNKISFFGNKLPSSLAGT